MADDGMSVRGFGSLIGRDESTVRHWIRKGIIPRNEDGTVPAAEALKAYREMQKGSETLRAAEDGGDALLDAKACSQAEAMNRAKLMEKTYQAKLRQLEFQEKKGELVSVEDVRADAQATAAALRQRLMSIPVRIAGLCEGRPTREIEEVIEDAINEALAQFQKSEYAHS